MPAVTGRKGFYWVRGLQLLVTNPLQLLVTNPTIPFGDHGAPGWVGLSRIRGWNQGMEKLFTGLFTPSLLPVACADSTK
jgi:hypothetical protein